MGHASAQITRSIYLHALPESARRVVAVVNQVLPPHPDDVDDEQALRSTLLSLRVRRAAFGEERDV